MMAAIVNYGIGNLYSVKKGLERAGFAAVITTDGETIKRADLVVLPGVGSHKAAMINMERMSLIEAIKTVDAWILGICLGMQLLFERSEEGNLSGLGIMKGNVVRLRVNAKVPHMGWNDIKGCDCELLEGLEGKYFYFAHSYYVPYPSEGARAYTEYAGSKITSVVWKDKVVGTQFHPEKSYKNGLAFFKNLRRLMRS